MPILDRLWRFVNDSPLSPNPVASWFWPNTPWAPGMLPNPWAVPSDPSADGSADDPYSAATPPRGWPLVVAPTLTLSGPVVALWLGLCVRVGKWAYGGGW